MKALVVGATGKHGSLVLAELLRRGVVVRALVRDEQRAAVARSNGAQETVVGDLLDLDSLRRATQGVEGVFHLGPAFAPEEARMGTSLVQAATESGARRFVLSGVIHPPITAMSHHTVKLPVQEALYESGMAFTILQPGMFMQNLAPALRAVVNEGRLPSGYALDSKMCWVDYRDVAEVAALAMTGDELAYGTFELCAPGRFDTFELADMASEVLGREVTPQLLARQVFAQVVPEGPMRDTMIRMLDYYDEYGFTGGNDLVLRSILQRSPRTLMDFLCEHLKSGEA